MRVGTRLVGLQLADEVPAHLGRAGGGRRGRLRQQLLHVVLAKVPAARTVRSHHRVQGFGLADRDKTRLHA